MNLHTKLHMGEIWRFYHILNNLSAYLLDYTAQRIIALCQEISAGILTLRGWIEIGLYLNPGDFFTKNKA